MKKENFIGKVVNELLEERFSVKLLQEKKVEGCGGWFDSTEREILVALRNDMAFELFIHEYSHFRQWKYNNKYFTSKNKGVGKFFDWIDNKKKKVPDHLVQKYLKSTIELEHDCEVGALKMIAEHKLDVNVDDYVKAANAYLLSYHIVREQRKWWGKKSVYSKEILKHMPCNFMELDYYLNPDNITKGQRTLFLKALNDN